ncbi:MAG: cobalt-precorrin-5B (C(1))-methyltransferase CbiD [Desulfatibacillaceae bacterium]
MTRRDKKTLRAGFTTGTAAAAAAKAAMHALLRCTPPGEVEVLLLNGETWRIPVARCAVEGGATASCVVVKDAGDDPDVTHRAEIGARVTLLDEAAEPGVEIIGGQGVGRVTKPGLEVPPGEPAINPGPRKMITDSIREVLGSVGQNRRIRVEVFAPRGEELAKNTLNARLGILGGISILGTTGVVKPLSHDAYIATIRSSLSVARAAGLSTVVMTTGRRSEKHAQREFADLPEEAFIQIGDHFAESMGQAATDGFARVILAVFFGKAVKMAYGVPHTHAGKSRLVLDRLAGWAGEADCGGDVASAIEASNTAREAFTHVSGACPALLASVCERAVQAARGFAGPGPNVRMVLFDFDGNLAHDTQATEVAT